MMMAANPDSPLALVTAMLPPEFYFKVATLLLALVRALFVRRLAGRSGVQFALSVANQLSRAGMCSWRLRAQWRRR